MRIVQSMWRTALHGLIAASLGLGLVGGLGQPIAQAKGRCVLPWPDIDRLGASPPSLTGVIEQASPTHITVRSHHKNRLYSIDITPKTEIYTEAGGDPTPDQLGAGQHARVWLKHCAAPRPGTQPAAMVKICSTSPEPC